MEPVASQPRSTSWATVLESVWEEQGTQSPPHLPGAGVEEDSCTSGCTDSSTNHHQKESAWD